MSEGHHYDVSAAVAAEIVNLIDMDQPPSEATREVERRARGDATNPTHHPRTYTMPTPEQLRNVRTEIARLERSSFHDGNPVANDTGQKWNDLADNQKYTAMSRLPWEGFDREGQLDLMTEVVEGPEISDLMPGWQEELESMFYDMAHPPDFGEPRAWRGDELSRDQKLAIRQGLDWQDPNVVVTEPEKPPGHGTYQVWHGDTHRLDVEAVGVREVHELTGAAINVWAIDPAVSFITDLQRPTRVGDVIVDPTCGAWEIQADGYLTVEPPAPVKERMEREGIEPQHLKMAREWAQNMARDGGFDR